jgi:glycerophosphoryl diester phosphodiesterase
MQGLKSLILVIITLMSTTYTQAQTKVIAHRGAWKAQNIPQNSLASLNHAIELGCYGSEFDVHLTKDEVLVVNHDKDFYGIEIENSTYKELLTKQHPNGENIPTLEEYLKEGMKQNSTRLILEVKNSIISKDRTLKSTEKCVVLVKNLKANNLVDYIFFDYDAGKLVHKLDAKAAVAYLNGDIAPAQVKKDGYTGIDYHFSVYKKNPTWIKEAHNIALTVNAWTVNTKEEALNLIKQNVEFITTDEPEMLLDLLNARQ